MAYFAVIDTETNWADQVMSIGLVIAQEETMQPQYTKYYVLTPEYQVGGMYESTLFTESAQKPVICSRTAALADIVALHSAPDNHGRICTRYHVPFWQPLYNVHPVNVQE